jgi:Dyp-type peroxidase family
MEEIEWHDVQGLVLSGYPTLRSSAYVLWRFVPEKIDAAKQWLSHLAERLMRAGAEENTTTVGRTGAHPHRRHLKALKRADDRQSCAVNLALTVSGLEYLRLGEAALSHFSLEFLEGMSPMPTEAVPVPRRSNVLGDSGNSSPACWDWGGWTQNRQVDGILLLFAADDDCLQRLLDAELSCMANVAESVRAASPSNSPLIFKAQLAQDKKEHFGYTDGLSQPIIKGSPKAHESKGKCARASSQTSQTKIYSPEEQRILFVEPGEFLLGYLNERGARVGDEPYVGATSPWVEYGRDLRRNGTYLVFRQLEQDVCAFNRFLSAAALQLGGTATPAMREKVAGKLLGRRRDGTPMVPCPESVGDTAERNDFLYNFRDPFGISCPIGAHIRRGNPRDSLAPDPDTALRLSKMHRIIRRGRPYGERFDLARAEMEGDARRGMLFICLNSDIAGQFELIQHSWLNNPRFAGLHMGIDPFSHLEDPNDSLVIQSRPVNLNISRPHPFVKVRGGAYFFLPGIEAVRALSK